jgi:uncharacterized protein (DUF1778 family)
MKPRPVGRPSLGKTPTERLELRIDAARRKRWQRCADAAGVTLSDWLRALGDAEVEACRNETRAR